MPCSFRFVALAWNVALDAHSRCSGQIGADSGRGPPTSAKRPVVAKRALGHGSTSVASTILPASADTRLMTLPCSKSCWSIGTMAHW